MKFDAIKTTYNGIVFRSRFEANVAMLLDKMGWKWKYEPDSFLLPSGHYMPDFRCDRPSGRVVYIEARGYNEKDWQLDEFSRYIHPNTQYFVFKDREIVSYLTTTSGYHIETRGGAAVLYPSDDGTCYEIEVIYDDEHMKQLLVYIGCRSLNRWLYVLKCEHGGLFFCRNGESIHEWTPRQPERL